MSHPTTAPLRFDTPTGLPLDAAFDAGRLTRLRCKPTDSPGQVSLSDALYSPLEISSGSLLAR